MDVTSSFELTLSMQIDDVSARIYRLNVVFMCERIISVFSEIISGKEMIVMTRNFEYAYIIWTHKKQ